MFYQSDVGGFNFQLNREVIVMGFWSTLGWVAAGVGAVAVAPMTGGGSIAALVGATGTLTAGGAALGAATGATVASLAAPDEDDVAEARSRGEESG